MDLVERWTLSGEVVTRPDGSPIIATAISGPWVPCGDKVEVVPASQLQGAVDLIDRAIGPIAEALNNPAHSWHGSDDARKWLMDAARLRGQ